MARLPSHLRLLTCLFALAAAADTVTVASKDQREACPYWNAIGVLDDHLELMCTGGDEDWHLWKVDPGALEQFHPKEEESLAMACCPRPYKACKLSERVEGCDALIEKFVKAGSETKDPAEAYLLVQKARGALRNAHKSCQVLAEEEPHMTSCGGNPTGAALNRKDIFCEMMLWQSEQLGDGDESEYKRNGCPWPGKLIQAPTRHKGHLSMDELPESWARVQKQRDSMPRSAASLFKDAFKDVSMQQKAGSLKIRRQDF